MKKMVQSAIRQILSWINQARNKNDFINYLRIEFGVDAANYYDYKNHPDIIRAWDYISKRF